jgi:ParB family transcriptional regulator, chromosome partitioning protein
VSNERQRLGKGLEALIPKSLLTSGKTITNLPINQIVPNPFQPRLAFNEEALQQLSDSIRQHGLAQPIVVRRVGNQYELIAGERRFRATILAGLETIPAIIKNVSDRESLQLALIENLQREDLNAIEEAKGYVRLADEFTLTHQELAEVFGKSRSAVTNTLRLLQLPAVIQQAVSDGVITEGHARTILSLPTEAQQLDAFEVICSNNLNVREVEAYVGKLKKSKSAAKKVLQALPSALQDWEKAFSDQYETTVRIKGKPTRGKIEITYTSAKQLEQLASVLLTVR